MQCPQMDVFDTSHHLGSILDKNITSESDQGFTFQW